MNGTQRIAIALLGAFRTGDNRRMGDKSEFSGRRARFRAWLGRHFLAMIVVAIVLATLAYKNQWELYASSIDGNIVFDSGQCGWPAQWLDTLENVRTDAAGVDSHPLGPMAVEIRWGWLASMHRSRSPPRYARGLSLAARNAKFGIFGKYRCHR